MRLKSTILQGTAVVLVSALGITALARATLLWANIIYTLAVFLFIILAVGAACSRRQTRAFCLGTLLGGAGYVLAVFFSGSPGELLSSMAIKAAYPRLHQPLAPPIPGSDPNQAPQSTGVLSTTKAAAYGTSSTGEASPAPRYEYEWRLVKTPVDGPTQENFESIAHTLVTLIVAAGSGYMARFFHRRHAGSPHGG